MYRFVPGKCQTVHTHNLGKMSLILDGKHQIELQTDLTQTEIDFIKLLCKSIWNNMFPDAHLHTILQHICAKALNAKYGKYRSQIHELCLKGGQIKKHGGIFIVDPSPEDFGIADIH